MFYILSKVLWLIIIPFNVVFLLFFLGWLLLFRKPHTGKRLIGIGLVLLFICGLDFAPNYLTSLLENRIPAGHIPDNIDGIIILAGMVDMKASRPGLIELTGQADRIIAGIILARKHPEAKLVFTGGSGSLNQSDNLREADYLKKLAMLLGVSEDRISIERNSRNTHEHAVEIAKMLKDKSDGQWVLITSAFHIPRSLGSFRKEAINVIPYPVDFKTKSGNFTDLSLFPKISNISRFSSALHEWMGLIVYWMVGHTDSLFPAVK